MASFLSDNNVKEYKKGKIYLDKIVPILKTENDFEMFVSYNTLLGNYYSNINENKTAEKFYEIVLNRLKENNVEFFKPNELEIYDEIYLFYKKNKNIEKALYFLEKHFYLFFVAHGLNFDFLFLKTQ